jgi:hypothetical protein
MVVAEAQVTLCFARCSSTRWDQYAGALSWCRTQFPVHQNCRCFQRVASLRRWRISLYIVLFTVWPCGMYSWWTVPYCRRRLPTSPFPLLFLWRGQGLPVHWLLFSLWVVKVNPCFITCDYSVPQPRYFHDLALTDYYRFSRLEEQKGWRFASSDYVEAATMAALNGVTMNGLQNCFQKWYCCWQRCLMTKARYFKGEV